MFGIDELTIKALVAGVVGFIIVRAYIGSLMEPLAQVEDGTPIERHNHEWDRKTWRKRTSKLGAAILLFGLALLVGGIAVIWGHAKGVI